MIMVEIAFAPDSQTQLLTTVTLAEGTTVRQAIEETAWLLEYPQIVAYDVGIFSQKVSWEHVIKMGDRIEIYRPLTIQPQQKRQKLSKRKPK